MRQHSLRAFTLIELLIVVAIIAILAAIAVPNFLEAQMRAKVSAAQADIRSVATAIEAYRVDNQQYPNRPQISYAPGGTRFRQRLAPLTTPVAYLSSLPVDLFNPGVDAFSVNGNNTYAYGTTSRLGGAGGSAIATFLATYAVATGYPNPGGVEWVIYSYGPLMDPMGNFSPQPANNIYYMDTVYDPTNGTVSPGIICRVGPH